MAAAYGSQWVLTAQDKAEARVRYDAVVAEQAAQYRLERIRGGLVREHAGPGKFTTVIQFMALCTRCSHIVAHGETTHSEAVNALDIHHLTKHGKQASPEARTALGY